MNVYDLMSAVVGAKVEIDKAEIERVEVKEDGDG